MAKKKKVWILFAIPVLLVIAVSAALYFSGVLSDEKDTVETTPTSETSGTTSETGSATEESSITETAVSVTTKEPEEERPGTYYVSNDGDDNNSGLSEDEPWKTISKVSSTKYNPGDAILFRRGDVWYEALVIRSSGTKEDPIIYGNYGDGDLPRILGSVALADWENVEGSIWVSRDEATDPSMGADHAGQTQGFGGWPGGAWFEKPDGSVIWGNQEKYINAADDFADLTKEYDWGWFNDHVYIYSETDPAQAYTALQVSQRQSCAGFANRSPQEHIVIDGLQLSYAQTEGFRTGYPEMKASGLTIRNCDVGYIGIKGGAAAYGLSVWHSDLLIQDNRIHDCGRRGVSYNIYYTSHPRSMSFRNVTIEGNHFYNGFHTTGVDIANLSQASLRYFTIRNNLFEGDPDFDLGAEGAFNSNHLYTENTEGSLHSDFLIYNNIFTYCHGKGMMINGVANCGIYFNTFYGVNPTLANFQAQLFFSGDLENIAVHNNIFYNDSDPSFNRYFMCVKMDAKNKAHVDMDRNLYYTADPDTYMIYIEGTNFKEEHWDAYVNYTGWDTGSPKPQDPVFADAISGNLKLGSESPAVYAGVPIPDIKVDFEGKIRNDPPSLGAYEY